MLMMYVLCSSSRNSLAVAVLCAALWKIVASETASFSIHDLRFFYEWIQKLRMDDIVAVI